MNKRKKWFRKLLYSMLISLVLFIVVLLGCNWRINAYALPYTYDDISQLPPYKVGLVLGTSKHLGRKKNPYFVYRMNAAVELYHAGKIKYIVVSGDNSTIYYNEPEDMKDALVRKGIPEEAIYMDYAGFRTLDSVVRCREIFGQSQYIIISQQFHNARAIYIARQLGIEAIGYNARDVSMYNGVKTNVRELFARVKVFIDLYLTHQQPKFLGEKIIIP